MCYGKDFVTALFFLYRKGRQEPQNTPRLLFLCNIVITHGTGYRFCKKKTL